MYQSAAGLPETASPGVDLPASLQLCRQRPELGGLTGLDWFDHVILDAVPFRLTGTATVAINASTTALMTTQHKQREAEILPANYPSTCAEAYATAPRASAGADQRRSGGPVVQRRPL